MQFIYILQTSAPCSIPTLQAYAYTPDSKINEKKRMGERPWLSGKYDPPKATSSSHPIHNAAFTLPHIHPAGFLYFFQNILSQKILLYLAKSHFKCHLLHETSGPNVFSVHDKSPATSHLYAIICKMLTIMLLHSWETVEIQWENQYKIPSTRCGSWVGLTRANLHYS